MPPNNQHQELVPLPLVPAAPPVRGVSPLAVPTPVRPVVPHGVPAPATAKVGRGAITVPVTRAGHGRGAAVAPPLAAPPPQIPQPEGLIPLAQAAPPQLGVPPQPGILPVTEVLPQGISTYQYGGQAVNGRVDPKSLATGYKFLDPNTGRESGFPTLQAAQTALATASTPLGVDQAKAGLLERIRQVGGDTSQTNEAENLLLAPAALPPTAVAPPLAATERPSASRPAQNALGSRGFAPNEKIEIIRGVDSQVYNTNPQGLSPNQVYREHLNDSIISNLSGGRGALDASYALDNSGQPHRLQTNFDTLNALNEEDRKAANPSLNTVKAGRAGELFKNPAGISDADRLLFAPSEIQGQKREVYKQPVYDELGNKIGESPYLYNPHDPTGNATPLNLQEAQQGAPGQEAAEGKPPADYPDAYRAIKKDGKPGWFVKRKGKIFLVSN